MRKINGDIWTGKKVFGELVETVIRSFCNLLYFVLQYIQIRLRFLSVLFASKVRAML